MNLMPAPIGSVPVAEVSEPYAVNVADCDNRDIYAHTLDHLRQRYGVTITQTEFDHLCGSGASRRKSALDTLAEARGTYAKRYPTFHKFLAGLTRIFEPLENFKGALDILCQASGVSILLWGSIKTAIQVGIAAF